MSNFVCTVGRVDGMESAQGPHWSDNTPGAVSGVMGTIPRARQGVLKVVLYI